MNPPTPTTGDRISLDHLHSDSPPSPPLGERAGERWPFFINLGAARLESSSLPTRTALLLSLTAIISFHLAYSFSALSFLILIYLACLFQLSRLPSARIAFYFGLAIGTGCALQAFFFWNIFGPTAISLWLILGFWTGLFLALAQLTRSRLGNFDLQIWTRAKNLGRPQADPPPSPPQGGGEGRGEVALVCKPKFPGQFLPLLLIPFLWSGLEYFRSELYYLRFSWLSVGYVFSVNLAWVPIHFLGMYGIGFCLVTVVCLFQLLRLKPRLVAFTLALAALAILTNLPSPKESPSITAAPGNLRIAGIQLEFPSETQVLASLNNLQKNSPDAQLFVLSEYTFPGPVPDSVKNWCRKNHRYLIVGGEDPVSDTQYRDTAFVIGPDGKIVFQQAKSVPIQFFKDGLPAESQSLWASPWGKIGICICYDLSYTRVTDQLIRLGAQAIIVPSMDVIDWGLHQHELHYSVAPIRAAEYRIPIFRLASSGISQSVDASGRVLASAPFPGDGTIISSTLNLGKPGTLPLDRFLAPLAVAVDALLIIWLIFVSFTKRMAAKSNP
jgi:apolipoprotein N-acyltransferase